MSVAATTAPAQGWYPDPHDPAQLRWWDGAGWTAYTTDVPEPEPQSVPESHPFTDVIVDLAETDDDVPEADMLDDDALDAAEPIEFSWTDPLDRFQVTVPEFEPEPDGFTFRARALPGAVAVAERVIVEVPTVPTYESPLATIASPVAVRVEVPVRIEVPVVQPQPAAEPEPAVETQPEPVADPPAVSTRRRLPLRRTGTVVLVAAAAAGVTNMLGGDDSKPGKAAATPAAMSATAKRCLKEWNTTATGSAAQMRVTLGQFEGALARVGAVKPLPNTVMAADSCALSVYDPSTDTHAIFVSGVKDTVGYIDVTSYPRATTYGWPKNEGQANVAIRPDGSIKAL